MSLMRISSLFVSTIRGWSNGQAIQSKMSFLLNPYKIDSLTGPSLVPVRTFRDKAVLKLRCNDCYFKKIDYRWWVLCASHPRHKQREQVDDEKRKWIVTHETIGHRPFQKKEEAYICNLAPPGPYDYKRKMFYKTPESALLPKKHRTGCHRKLISQMGI